MQGSHGHRPQLKKQTQIYLNVDADLIKPSQPLRALDASLVQGRHRIPKMAGRTGAVLQASHMPRQADGQTAARLHHGQFGGVDAAAAKHLELKRPVSPDGVPSSGRHSRHDSGRGECTS